MGLERWIRKFAGLGGVSAIRKSSTVSQGDACGYVTIVWRHGAFCRLEKISDYFANKICK
jgi:hypothetical protein